MYKVIIYKYILDLQTICSPKFLIILSPLWHIFVDFYLDIKIAFILRTVCLFNQLFPRGIGSPQDVKEFKFKETGSEWFYA